MLRELPRSSRSCRQGLKLLIDRPGRSFVYLPTVHALRGLAGLEQASRTRTKDIACLACPAGIDIGTLPWIADDGLRFKVAGVGSDLPGTVSECLAVTRVFDPSAPERLDHPSYVSEAAEVHAGSYHATKQWLRFCGEDFRILHIASHAFVNDAFPGLSGIVLHGWVGAEPAERVLYQYEMESYNLETEMITLSCCDTARGEYARGEGVLSLAHALWLAGARSSVTTLWPVSDTRTSDLMAEFYAKVKQGVDRDLALAEAKRKAACAGVRPFYWAQFLFSGDWRPLYTTNGEPRE